MPHTVDIGSIGQVPVAQNVQAIVGQQFYERSAGTAGDDARSDISSTFVQIGPTARYYLESPPGGPRWGARLTITFLFPG